MTPIVSVIIISWNVAGLLRECLTSLRQAGERISLEVLVIDNASLDGSADLVAQEFPEVMLLRQSENLGFAKAVNIGIKASRGEYIFLLNPDATVSQETLPKLVEYLATHPQIGIVGPRILNGDGSVQISTNRFPTFLDQAIVLTKIDHFLPRLGPIKRYTYADEKFSEPAIVDQVKGAAFLFRRSLTEHIGLFDERFFLWFEEVDFCLRAAQVGIRTAIIPSVSVRHHGGRSFHQRYSIDKHRIFLASLKMFFTLHRPAWERAALMPFYGISYLVHLLATPFHPR